MNIYIKSVILSFFFISVGAVSTARPYDIIIGKNILEKAGAYINTCLPPCRLCIITDSTVNSIYAQVVMTSLMEHGYQTSKIVFPAGEHSKNLTTYSLSLIHI